MHNELWAFGKNLVIIPQKGKYGLIIGYDPNIERFPGIDEGKAHAVKELSLQLISNNRPGFGWKHYGWDNLSFSIPNKFAPTILTFLFDIDGFNSRINK